MIVKIRLIEGVSPEMKAQIDLLAKNAESAGFDLYPCEKISETQFFAQPYKQLHTVTGDWDKMKSLIPNTLKYEGDGVFSLAKSGKSA